MAAINQEGNADWDLNCKISKKYNPITYRVPKHFRRNETIVELSCCTILKRTDNKDKLTTSVSPELSSDFSIETFLNLAICCI